MAAAEQSAVARHYLPGVDGLRALAVLAVLAYHLGFSWAPGGFLGVDLFFVISGFLITGLLAADWDRRGRVDLPRFWVRRARRLLPALAAMVLVVVAVAAVADPARLEQLRGDVLAAATYTSNWWQIAEGQSYYAQFEAPSLLQHLWSLAVEEQFYLLWPLLLVAGLRWLPRHRLTRVVLVAAFVSAAAMAMLYRPGEDPSRVYFGTDTHAAGLLLGAALALAWPAMQRGRRASGLRWGMEAVGLLGLVGFLAGVRYLAELDATVYRGGLALVSLGGAALVAAAAHESTVLGRVLAVGPLRWIGVRSYGIYLWHWPVILFAGSLVHAPGAAGLGAKLVVSALAVGLAAASWRYLEQPIRVHGFGKTIRRALRPLRHSETVRRPAVALSASASFAIVALAVTGLLTARPVTDTAAAQIAAGARAIATAANDDRLVAETKTPIPDASGPDGPLVRPGQPDTEHQPNQDPDSQAEGPNRERPTRPEGERRAQPRRLDVTAIGDSVMLAAAVALQERLPGVVIDADVGRQMDEVPGVVRTLRGGGRLGDVVILAVGNNGTVSSDQMRAALREIGPERRVVLINTYVPLSWQDSVNAVLARTAATDRRVTLVDWHSAAEAHRDLMYDDAVHPRPEGAEIYARLVASEVRRAYRELTAEQRVRRALPQTPQPLQGPTQIGRRPFDGR